MSKITINNIEYDIKLNRMFIQPHLVINDMTTDIGIWDDTNTDEQKKLLLLAVECYNYHKSNNTIKDGYCHIHDSRVQEKKDILKMKHNYLVTLYRSVCSNLGIR